MKESTPTVPILSEPGFQFSIKGASEQELRTDATRAISETGMEGKVTLKGGSEGRRPVGSGTEGAGITLQGLVESDLTMAKQRLTEMGYK